MKKLLLSIICFSLIFVPATGAQAAEARSNDAEGYYYEEEITIIEAPSAASVSTASTTSAKTITSSKRTNVKASDGTVLWYVEVTATFTYNGVTSRCTSSSVTAVSKNSNWRIASKSSSKSGNQGRATATAKRYSGGEAVSSMTKTVTLICTASGQLS